MFLEKSLFCWHGGMKTAFMPGKKNNVAWTWDTEALFRGIYTPHATMPGMPGVFKLFCQKLGVRYYATQLARGGIYSL